VKPWLIEQWCFAPTADPDFVRHMADGLDGYERPSDATPPAVCLDEPSRQLLGDTREPRPAVPGVPARVDPEYGRGGVAQLFLVTEPVRGWRQVAVGARRTRLDFAQCVRDLGDVHSPAAERIGLVIDQVTIHDAASREAAFPAAEARRLARKLEIPHTPKHGSWLNMAELELSVLARQCLAPRLPDQPAMTAAVRAWAGRRTAAMQTVDWPFTTADARIKLRHLYPEFDM
jgi:hypothetical protein